MINEHYIAHLAAIVESSDDAMLSKTLDGVITSWNHGAEKIFGYSADEIIGKHISTLIPPKLHHEEIEFAKKIRNGEKINQYETERIRKDGSVLNASITISPIKDVNGKIIGLSTILRDITQQLNAALELKLLKERFQVLIENNQAIISLTDDALNSIYRSPSYSRIVGWTDDDMKTKGGIDYFHSDDIVKVKTAVAVAIKKPGMPQLYSGRYLHKNGHYIWMEGTVTKLPDESIIKGIVFNSLDVTERKIQDEKIRKASRLNAFIGQINQMIVRTTNETALFKEVCRIALELGQVRMAWIGMIDESTQKVIPVIHAGTDDGYLSEINIISTANVPEGRGPIGTLSTFT